MKTPRHQIAATLARRTLRADSRPKLALEIAAYLLAERRTSELGSLVRDMMQYRADQGVVEVSVVSARPLSTAVRADVTAKAKMLYPGATEVIIADKHDPSVIGGVRLELPNQQLDLTVRAKLNRFKQLTAQGKE